MAERRMFAKTIIDSDAFLDMPLSTQALYFHLSMRADDDGFLNNAKKIMRTIGCNQNDYDLLIAKSFIIQFPEGICVIKHWRINNYLRNDRYKPTIYAEEKAMLTIQDNGRYSLENEVGIPNGYQMETQYRLGKDRLGKDSIDGAKSTRFVPPTHDEVQSYVQEKGYKVDADRFINFYESKGWMVGKNKMKDWKAAIRNWATRETPKPQQPNTNRSDNNYEDLERKLLGL